MTIDPQSPQGERRSFLTWILWISGLASTGLILYPILRFLLPVKPHVPEGPLPLGTTSDLAIGEGKLTNVLGKPIIWTRVTESEWRAFEGICTHQDCPLEFRKGEGFFCACHDGLFDLQGAPQKGPPTTPLPRYAVDVRGNDILVKLS